MPFFLIFLYKSSLDLILNCTVPRLLTKSIMLFYINLCIAVLLHVILLLLHELYYFCFVHVCFYMSIHVCFVAVFICKFAFLTLFLFLFVFCIFLFVCFIHVGCYMRFCLVLVRFIDVCFVLFCFVYVCLINVVCFMLFFIYACP